MKIKDCLTYCSSQEVSHKIVDFFKQCPARVQDCLNMNRISKGKILIHCNTPPHTVYFWLKGRLQIFDEDATEFPLCLFEASPFEIVGDYEMFSKGEYSISTVIACTDCICLSLPAGIYRTWISSDAHALFLRTQMLMKQLSKQVSFERRFLYMDYEPRCLHLLLTECRCHKAVNGQIRLPVKREDLAAKAGCSLRTINRIIENLKNRGLINLCQGKIQISRSQQENLLSMASSSPPAY